MLFASHHDEVELDWRLKRRATPGVKPDIRRGQTLGREMGRGEEGRAKGVPAGCTLDRLLAGRCSLLIAHFSLLAACSWLACCLLLAEALRWCRSGAGQSAGELRRSALAWGRTRKGTTHALPGPVTCSRRQHHPKEIVVLGKKTKPESCAERRPTYPLLCSLRLLQPS
jgi:hypothetical protein